ncbi:hypothetical protein [Mycolicibacterium litorale]|uniref:Chitin-binding protein n=1 Tax=Mycolicibacterium litorale TaxID=758802 RepID=A0AAD1MUL6_9MYCO|nr:hypothetical protein [Mycolicibacterium litorale]MCV7415131.1 hypothetical protein [Mycolicibacterium litorale]TDY08382.1 hypothetical protein BCL50_0446 [Mycolicibacterium litorale]BBY16306.1 hypothetical protein MLIT_18980 [Mycolicibacterium litorale]
MNVTRALGTSALAAGIGIAGLLGVGPGTATADPGPDCNRPGTPACAQNGPGAPGDWQRRGPDQARQDHRPFNWHGQQVTPMRAGNGDGWGFWFLGQWIRL